MKIVNPHLASSIQEQGLLKPPNSFGYLHLAAEVERPGLFSSDSSVKKALLSELLVLCKALKSESGLVQRADVFNAFIIPPGAKEGREVIERNGYKVHIAAFDIVVLIECASVEDAVMTRDSENFKKMNRLLEEKSKYFQSITAKNPKRIDEVDKDTKGIFLFNYFFSKDTQPLLDVWEYTAGWWTKKANLTNSTPLQPIEEGSEYSLINHCRWNKLMDVLPSLLFKPTLKQFVLKNFTVNEIVAMPILYKVVQPKA